MCPGTTVFAIHLLVLRTKAQASGVYFPRICTLQEAAGLIVFVFRAVVVLTAASVKVKVTQNLSEGLTNHQMCWFIWPQLPQAWQFSELRWWLKEAIEHGLNTA